MYRPKDLLSLERYYLRTTNDFVVCYGNERCGLIDLIKAFTADKEWFYYKVPDVTSKLSQELFLKALVTENKAVNFMTDNYERIFSSYIKANKGDTAKKKIIVFDDFTNLINDNSSYIDLILNLISEKAGSSSCLFLLLSTDENWIENDMVKTLGKRTYEFTAIHHVESMTLSETIEANPLIKQSDILSIYSCIGGNASLWKYVNPDYNFKNLCQNQFLDTSSVIFNMGMNIIPAAIRQEQLYNTILYYIAKGYNKLNDLCKITDISRTKLFIYIKNLIKENIIYKAESIQIGKSSNILKGIYRIKDPFVRFWYYFIYPNLSYIYYSTGDDFYGKIISPGYNKYLREYYIDYCIYYMEHLLYDDIIKDNMEICRYLDKNNMIDFIINTRNLDLFLCSCRLDESFNLKDLEQIKTIAAKNSITYTKIILISNRTFDKKLHGLVEETDYLMLENISL